MPLDYSSTSPPRSPWVLYAATGLLLTEVFWYLPCAWWVASFGSTKPVNLWTDSLLEALTVSPSLASLALITFAFCFRAGEPAKRKSTVAILLILNLLVIGYGGWSWFAGVYMYRGDTWSLW
jgi:hypothetical protein